MRGELSSEWGELSSECGASCLGASFLWGELSWGELSLGRVVRNPMGRAKGNESSNGIWSFRDIPDFRYFTCSLLTLLLPVYTRSLPNIFATCTFPVQ